jgi:glutamate-ammonia-ligase adenylyltransferase
MERWREAAREGDGEAAAFAAALAQDARGAALLASLFGNSPHLGAALLRDLAFARLLLAEGPDAAVAGPLDSLRSARAETEARAERMRRMRTAKARIALATALADICGAWPLERVTGVLTETAEAALSAACAHLLGAAASAGEIALEDAADPEKGSGLVVLGMGKLGGRELNYSSDIDLIVLYDAARVRTIGRDSPGPFFVRLARDLVRMMEERTADGYVFRTDLNLRPDPGSTPLAISTLAAEVYYESAGQNWERAAMIKARPVAGDLAAGEDFLALLRPFVWRKNLDFAAIQDIHSIKRQINAHRGGAAIAVGGHNVKLGRGGIREIEFFAQTQQLIWGGRNPALRARATCAALAALAAAGLIAEKAESDLARAYGFLRRLEHRLQMVEDRQTHVLPKDDAGIRHIALFMGYDDAPSFVAAYLAELRTVEEHYARLFEEAPALGGPGNLVFTGSEDDPETILTLRGMGYAEPSRVAEIVRAWHRGRFRAMRSARAREILTELMPALLAAFAKTANPDAALLKFNEFLAALPAGVHLFSLLYQNPPLLELLAEVLGSAPRIADALARNPALLEGVLGAEGAAPPDDPAPLAASLEAALGQARVFEDALDIVRRWNAEHVFRVGLAVLRNAIDAASAGPGLAAVAETAIRALAPRVAGDFAKRHGRIAGRGMAIVGLGKLGGREMTFASDLDLMFVYDAGSATESSDGPAPLAATQYFARLGQRVIGALAAPTAEGKLYEVDMRLRPSGHSGPIATSMESFARYHDEAAWTWEHMALTRARAIAGDERLASEIDAAIRAVLTRRRDPDKLVFDVADMRARMERELTRAGDIWEVKHLRGGLVDVEFIAQYLQLRHGHDHPEMLDVNTAAALGKLARAGLIAAGIAAELADALHLWRNVQGMLRLTTVGSFDAAAAPEGLQGALARAAGEDDFASVAARIEAAAARVRAHFAALIEQPAARVAPALATGQLEKEGRR